MAAPAVRTATVAGARLLTLAGVLDNGTYLTVRDHVIEAALEKPRAVLVDVDALTVPAGPAWAAFSSARWHVRSWPDVPIVLVCRCPSVATEITRHGVVRAVPVRPDVDAALRCLGESRPSPHRRAEATVPASPAGPHRARTLVAGWLTGWGHHDLILTATLVVDALVDNVLAHTDSAPVVLAESDGATVTVAVRDPVRTPAVRREPPAGAAHRISGLDVVASSARAWGCAPTGSGKTVWAVLGPENRV